MVRSKLQKGDCTMAKEGELTMAEVLKLLLTTITGMHWIIISSFSKSLIVCACVINNCTSSSQHTIVGGCRSEDAKLTTASPLLEQTKG